MKSFWKYILIFILVSTVPCGFAQVVSVSAKLDTNAMLIGDHVGMTLKYTGPGKSQVLWPFMPDTILGRITIIGRGKIDTSYTPDKKVITLSQQLNITCYDSGFYTIPSIPFRYRILPDTANLSATTTMLLLAVHTIKVDTTKAIKPIIGPLRVPITFREILPWLLVALAVVVMIIAGIWYFVRRKTAGPVFSLKPRIVLLPHELALQELEKLRVKKLWQSGKIKEYHSELTEILRRYIEERYHVPALEQTSAEILESMIVNGDCPRKTLDRLGDLMILADMVKFAKLQPVATENDKSLTDGIEFVYSTFAGTTKLNGGTT